MTSLDTGSSLPTPHGLSPPLTFLVVGCQRCGTTWLDAALREHPEVFLPKQKQTYFFDRNYDKGIEWYAANFEGREPAQTAVGEVATGYSLPHAIPRMHRHLPGVRLIMIVRDPIQRAYSYFLSRRAEQGWKSFEAALDDDPGLIDRGHYIDQIEAILERYPRERLLVLLYDDLAADDSAFLASALTFLGVDATFRSSQIGKQRNSAMFPRLRRFLHRAGLKPVLMWLGSSRVGDAVRSARKKLKAGASHSVSPATQERLRAHFTPYNDRLAAFLERDLSHWSR
jgi:hypothetical protein